MRTQTVQTKHGQVELAQFTSLKELKETFTEVEILAHFNKSYRDLVVNSYVRIREKEALK